MEAIYQSIITNHLNRLPEEASNNEGLSQLVERTINLGETK